MSRKLAERSNTRDSAKKITNSKPKLALKGERTASERSTTKELTVLKKSSTAKTRHETAANGPKILVPSVSAEAKSKERAKMAKIKPEPQESYEDDFEEYESDFEDSEESDAKVEPIPDKPADSLLFKKLENRTMESYSRKYAATVSTISEPVIRRPLTTARRIVIELQPTSQSADYNNENTTDVKSQIATPSQSKKKFYEYFRLISAKNATKCESTTQTGFDRISDGTQSEQIDVYDASTQMPPAVIGHNVNIDPVDDSSDLLLRPLRNQKRLRNFLDATAQTVLGLISADTERISAPPMQRNSNALFSSRYSTFSCALEDNEFCCVCFPSTIYSVRDENTEHTVLSGIYIPSSNDKLLHKKSFLLEYDYHNAEEFPRRVLTCEGKLSCCSYFISSKRQKFVVAGLTDGSCVAWILDDVSTAGTVALRWRDRGIIALKPVFDSAGSIIMRDAYAEGVNSLPNRESRNDGEVVALQALRGQQDSDENAFVSLHSSGTVIIWLIRQKPTNSTASNCITSFTSSYQFTKFWTINCTEIIGRNRLMAKQKLHATCLEVMPGSRKNSERCFAIGTESGVILQVKPQSSDAGGLLLRQHHSSFEPASEIRCIRSSSTDCNIFAAGRSDSLILLYHRDSSTPLRILPVPKSRLVATAVTQIEWAIDACHVLYVAYGNSHFAVWRLNDIRKHQQLASADICDFKADFHRDILAIALCKDSSGHSYMAFGLNSDNIAVHCMEELGEPPGGASLLQLLGRSRVNNSYDA